MALFTAPRPSTSRQRSASHSTDDHASTNDTPHRLAQRSVRDLTISSQFLATASDRLDDLPTPSAPAHPSHSASAHSTPMTSPSTGHSSLFPGSLSSATSDSVPSVESKFRSEFGLLTQESSAHSPIHGSTSSRSSQPISPRSRYMAESDFFVSAPRLPRKHPSAQAPRRPSTAPHTSSLLSTATSAHSPTEHSRSHSRLTVSIKNLLSKTSLPSPSRLSFSSVKMTPSNSDASSHSFQTPTAGGKTSMTPRRFRPPDLEISGTVAFMPSSSHTSNTSIDAHHRYASEVVAKSHDTRMGNGPHMSRENLDISIQNVPPSPVRAVKTRNVLRRRPSGSAKLVKGRDRSKSSPPRPCEDDSRVPPSEYTSRPGGPPLTAAGAVVEAYKQQDLHRDDLFAPPKLSIDDRMSSTASYDSAYGRDHSERSPTPYYTVFGSSSLTQVGSPDELWSKVEVDRCVGSTLRPASSHQPSGSDSGGGGPSIVHKVSMRWRKGKGGEDSPLRYKGHSKGQSSLIQELSNTRSTGQSMDSVSNTGDGAWTSSTANHTPSVAEKGGGSEGGKLWRLMRRISTGSLRERFQPNKVVPPVPAIPKELLEKSNNSGRSNEPLSIPDRQPSSTLYGKELTRTTTAPENMSVVRPSIRTANLFDIPSPQFFHKIHSPCSSVSSHGEPVVRIPEPKANRHIITPLEQLRLGDDHIKSSEPGTTSVRVPRSPRRSTSVPAGLKTAKAGCDQMPLPSSRSQTCSGESPSSSRSSSTSTPASGSSNGSSQGQGVGFERSRMVDGTVPLSPPPRPPRSSKRAGSGSMTSSPPHSIVGKQGDGNEARQMDRTPSGRSDMTARPESSESARLRGQANGLSPVRAQLTFRALHAPRRPPLSEREKADIWNDLLARSDEAGGTLHINGATELMSDSLRFSTHSELS